MEEQAHGVHGGGLRSVDQPGAGTHEGEARECEDRRSEFQPRGLHVSPKGSSQAHRRDGYLYTRQLEANSACIASETFVPHAEETFGGIIFDIVSQPIRLDLYRNGE